MRRRVHSLYFKNFIIIALLFSISFLILGAAFGIMSYRFITQERASDMMESTQTTAQMISGFLRGWEVTSLDVRALLIMLSDATGYHILITDDEGVVLNCSDMDRNCAHVGMSVPAGAVSTVNRESSFEGVTALGDLFEARRYVVGIPIAEGRRQGYIFMSDETGRLPEIWRTFAEIYFAAAVAVVLLYFGLSFVVMRQQMRPIKEMIDASRAYSRGDFAPRVFTGERHDEIAELAESFNVMADSLERSEKARRELIANVSHELKTPMTTITGFADGILDGTIPAERADKYLQIISSETKRLSRLVRGMLDMSQLRSLTPMEIQGRRFDILDVVCQTLLSLEQKITGRGLDVDARLPEEPIRAVGDRDAITQVVYNLLDNAAKFAEAGSTITVTLWREEGRVFFSVENHGETIPKEELPLIFDRFHKTDRSRSMDREGVGLGLYIVKTILDSHGGDIYVTSHDGVTKFVFALKLAKN